MRLSAARVPLVGALAVLLVPLGLAVQPGVPAASAPPAPHAPAMTAEAKAFAEAEATGKPTEITELRDEYTQTFANPDGGSYLQQTSAAPAFGRDVDGDLVPVDVTLEPVGGGFAPVATAARVVFPAGGSSIVSMSFRGQTIKVTMPGRLGEPTVDGSTATYANVYPEIDLKLTAVADGYQQVLVVKSRAAARNTALKRLTMPVDGQSVRPVARAGGGALFVDELGGTVIESASAVMWDSSGPDAAVRAGGPKAAAVPTPPEHMDPSPGDKWTEMPVSVAGKELRITPDQKLLSDADTEFPVYIDPNLGVNTAERVMLRSDGWEKWDFQGDEGMGRCPISFDYGCDGDYRKRLYYEFPRANLNGGDHVLRAEFAVTETWSMSCTSTPLVLEESGLISTNSEWPGPPVVRYLGQFSTAKGHSSSCPDGEVAFSNGAVKDVAEDMAAGQDRTAFRLRALDETNQWQWKRFVDNAVFRVWYVREPGAPTNVGVDEGGTTYCQPNSDYEVITWPSPQLKATVQTKVEPPTGTPQGQLRARFHFQGLGIHEGHANEWTDVFATAKESPSGGAWASDGQPQVLNLASLDFKLWQGKLYRMRALTRSNWNIPDYNLNGDLYSDPTGWCYFMYDPDPPVAPIVEPYEDPAVYPEDTGLIKWGGGPGVAGRFKYRPGSPDNDPNIEGYVTQLIGPGTFTPVTGPPPGSIVKPSSFGHYRILVSAEDVRGRDSDETEYHFNVKPPAPEDGRWHVTSADTSSNVTDSSGTAEESRHHLSLAGGAAITGSPGLARRGGNDAADRALAFDGTGYARTATDPVLRTGGSFTIAAWAMVNDTTTDRTVASQYTKDGSRGFDLQYLKASNTWSFGWTYTDSGEVKRTLRATAPAKAVPNAWTYVMGVYNATAKQLQLWINGRKVASPAVTTTTAPTTTDGRFFVGASGDANSATARFAGLVDEIRVWNYAASDQFNLDRGNIDEATNHPYVAQVANWEASAAGMADTSQFARGQMTLSGGATLDTANQIVKVNLDGVDGKLAANGPFLDETGSFTVGTKMSIDASKLVAKDRGTQIRILGQRGDVQRDGDGNGESSWALWFEKVSAANVTPVQGFWRVGRWSAPGSARAPASTETMDPGKVANLTGSRIVNAVYDAKDQLLHVYAGNEWVDSVAYEAPSQGAGELLAGWGPEKPNEWLPGTFTRVTLWAGAMSSDQISAIAVGTGEVQ